MMPKRPFVLASASPRRQQLLREAGYDFRVEVSHVEEPDPAAFSSAEAYVVHTAWLKAHAIDPQTDEWILSADTMVEADGRVIGKAATKEEARELLTFQSGGVQRVITGVCLRLPAIRVALSDSVVSLVRTKPLPPDELEAYLESGLWEGKAGAYGIQDEGDPFVTLEEGSFTNVVGLPMERLAELFGYAGVIDASRATR